MPRIAGVNIPESKRLEIALTYIFGIGRTKSNKIITSTGLDKNMRAKDLTGEQIQKLSQSLATVNIEGDLKKQLRDNIERLKHTGSYRGLRHTAGLPVRGQRTRTNARTKRGKRITIGAMKKDDATKMKSDKK